MGIVNREYIAEEFFLHDKIKRDLSLIFSNDGFSFAVFDKSSKLIALRVYQLTSDNKLKECLEAISTDRILKSIFNKVHIGFGGVPTALVPEKLFDRRFPESYLSTAEIDPVKGEYWIDEVSSISGKNIHLIESELKDQLADYFPGAVFMHKTTAVIEYLSKDKSSQKGISIHVQVDKNLSFVFLFENGTIVHNSNFEFQNPNDFLYHLMHLYQDKELDPETVPLNISGMLDANSLIYDKLYRYIRTINWATINDKIELTDYQSVHPAHYDLELFALHLCE